MEIIDQIKSSESTEPLEFELNLPEFTVTINDIADWDKLNLDYELNINRYFLIYDDIYKFINALIVHDGEALYDLTARTSHNRLYNGGIKSPEMFDCYKTFVINSYSISRTEEGRIYFGINISANKSGLSPELERFTEGYNSFWFEGRDYDHFFLFDDDFYNEQYKYIEQTPALTHLLILLGRSGNRSFDFFGDSGGFKSPDASYTMTQYMVMLYGDNNSSLSTEELKETAKKYFDVSDFVPSGYTNEDGRYFMEALTIPSPLRKIKSEMIDDEGNTVITMQFYVDFMQTIRSHKIRYTIKQLEDDHHWQFISAELLYRSPWEPYIIPPN